MWWRRRDRQPTSVGALLPAFNTRLEAGLVDNDVLRKIFDELDMNMLVAIVTRMKEVRSAPIIAAMNPSKAKELSIELTKHQSLEQ